MEKSNLFQVTMQTAQLAAMDAMAKGSNKQGFDVRAFRQALVRVVQTGDMPLETSHAE